MVVKAIIFDLDGTLAYTAPEYRYLIVGKALQELGVIPSNNHIDMFWFGAERDKIIKECFGLEPERFWRRYRQHDNLALRTQFTKVYDDVVFIQELRQRGYKIGLVTGAPSHIANLEIGMLGKENFDAIVFSNPSAGIKEKPHPQGLEKCLSLLGVQRNEAVYVGNGDEDIMMAKEAQVFDVLVNRGEHSFLTTKPSLEVSSLYGLRQHLGL